jgi:hypothetical protein
VAFFCSRRTTHAEDRRIKEILAGVELLLRVFSFEGLEEALGRAEVRNPCLNGDPCAWEMQEIALMVVFKHMATTPAHTTDDGDPPGLENGLGDRLPLFLRIGRWLKKCRRWRR